MVLGVDDNVTIHIGKGFSSKWDFVDSDGETTDLSHITSAKATLRNIDEEFSNDPIYDVGIVGIINGGTVTLDLTSTDTNKIKIPSTESNPYTHNNIYAKIVVEDNKQVPILDLYINPLKV
jgi:hypothetical protein